MQNIQEVESSRPAAEVDSEFKSVMHKLLHEQVLYNGHVMDESQLSRLIEDANDAAHIHRFVAALETEIRKFLQCGFSVQYTYDIAWFVTEMHGLKTERDRIVFADRADANVSELFNMASWFLTTNRLRNFNYCHVERDWSKLTDFLEAQE